MLSTHLQIQTQDLSSKMTLTWTWREASHVADFFARRARHKEVWTGVHDRGAVDYANRHNISQYYEGYPPTPGHLVPPIYRQICFHYLYYCNIHANEETTLLHDKDPEEKSGDSCWKYGRDDWYLCTRGQKLRTIRTEIEFFERFRNGGGEVDLWKMVSECLEFGREMRTKRLQKDFECCEWVIKSYERLRGMVERETEAGWDWKIGLREQCGERVKQGMVIEGFIMDGAEGKSMLGEALGFFLI